MNTFLLRYKTWDGYHDTQMFESIGEFHAWADGQEELDKGAYPLILTELSLRGRNVRQWTERQIEEMRQSRYRELHADEIAAEKERTEVAKAKRAAEDALLPPYTRDYLTELRVSRDEYGNEVFAFDGIVLPFKLSDVNYDVEPAKYQDITHRGSVVAQVQTMGSVGKLTLTIPLYRGDDPTKTFRITRPMEDES